jgi:hypothetical protein
LPSSRSVQRCGPGGRKAINILDDSLSVDRERAAELSPLLTERTVDLARYARKIGADGILFTCSAFGGAIEQAAKLMPVPVLKPNEAMFEAAIKHGRNVAMIVTFAPAQSGMEASPRRQPISGQMPS